MVSRHLTVKIGQCSSKKEHVFSDIELAAVNSGHVPITAVSFLPVSVGPAEVSSTIQTITSTNLVKSVARQAKPVAAAKYRARAARYRAPPSAPSSPNI